VPRPTLIRLATFVATVVAAWGVLSLGTSSSDLDLTVGALAPDDFVAQSSAPVEDTDETERLRQEARDAVVPIREVNIETESQVRTQVNALFDDVAALAIGDAVATTPTTLPESSTTTTEATTGTDETETTEPPPPAILSGLVFIDVEADGVFQPDAEGPRIDRGIERLTVQVSIGGEVQTVTTGPEGAWSVEVEPGSAIVSIDSGDPQLPDGYVIGTDNLNQLVECAAGEECQATPIGFKVNLRPIPDVTAQITAGHPVAADAVDILAATAADDVIRAALGEPLHLDPAIRQAVLQRINELFGQRTTPEQVADERARQRTSPPLVFYADTSPPGQDMAASDAAGEVVATFLQANYLIDEVQTEAERVRVAEEVDLVMVNYTAGQPIVNRGEPMSALHIAAIEQTGALVTEARAGGGLLAVLAVLVGVLGLYLSRFRPEFWARPRMVALFGILLVLAAGAVRATVILQPQSSWYVLPAVAFGFMTAVLFDSRIAVLMALSVGVLAAVGARDTGVAVYAALATMAPIPFVSAVSSRGAFRNAVIFSSFTAALAAGATSWFFHVGPNEAALEVIGTSMAWAFGVSAVASLVGLAALQFFESAFDITTSLSLLDLTDRNHEALQLLQEKAFGSFNHSLMVGTLAHAAARAIGANALLARAMAYYHDLGKTENPTMFIENQFGIPNPHDFLTPKESADVIRRHVSDGIVLARQFKIPSDVATGIVSHHGDGIMRFFYEKARAQSGDDVNPDDFRHIGHKPRTAESAIVMLSDSLEAACRANFQTEEPTPEAIEKVVDRIIDEKLNDGQLSESPLTLSEMTQIRSAFLDSLVGHYHQRIAYPNFPGS
jgi:putative nucleotidyltransferase with HDIG domain